LKLLEEVKQIELALSEKVTQHPEDITRYLNLWFFLLIFFTLYMYI